MPLTHVCIWDSKIGYRRITIDEACEMYPYNPEGAIHGGNMKLEIVKGDITEIKCDAIVCSTNKELISLGSIDTAIHGAAGPELEKACEKIQ